MENCSKMMWLTKLAPKKFLCRFPLRKGATFVGILTLAISLICVIIETIEILYYKKCKDCTPLVMHNVYSFSINAIIYCFIMIFINLWFIWGVKFVIVNIATLLMENSIIMEKSTVVISWVMITGMWWIQSFTLVFVLMCMYVTDTSLGWMVALGCTIIAFMIFLYCILVVYGYWLEIRKPSQTTVE